MGSETKPSNGGGGFRAKMEHYLYSGDKKHVFAGIAIITAVFAVPWFLMNRDTIYSIGYIPRCTFPLAVFQVHSLAAGQNINPIKITWKKPTKPGVKDFLQHPLHLND